MFSLAEGNLKHLYGPPTFDPLEFIGKHLVFNQDDNPIKVTIKRVLGDNSYALKLGEDHEKVFTHDEIITALNKKV